MIKLFFVLKFNEIQMVIVDILNFGAYNNIRVPNFWSRLNKKYKISIVNNKMVCISIAGERLNTEVFIDLYTYAYHSICLG